MPGRARWRGGGRARQRPGVCWLASAGRVICAAMRVHARARMRVLCTSAACTVIHCMRAPPEPGVERWPRHLRCHARARTRAHVHRTMRCMHDREVERAGGRVAPARAPVFGGLFDPSHGIASRLAPSGFRRCSCCAPSPVAALEVGVHSTLSFLTYSPVLLLLSSSLPLSLLSSSLPLSERGREGERKREREEERERERGREKRG